MKFTNIQVIRFAAATLILLMHLGYYSQHELGVHGPAAEFIGERAFSMGVVAFFVVSGFVLSHSLQTTSIPRFLGLRAARIYPPFWTAYALVISGQLLAGVARPEFSVWRFSMRSFLRAMLLIPPDGNRAYHALGVEWTLVYEVFFYAALGLLALCGRRRGVPAGAAIWLCLCIGRAAIAPARDGVMYPSWTGIILSPMIPPFLFGVLAYYGRHQAARIRLWTPLVGATLIAVGYAAGYAVGKPDVYSMLAGAGFALVVLWVAGGPQLPADHALVRFGDYSYGVYLAHVPILILLFTKGAERGWVPRTLAGVVAAGLVTLLIGLGYGRLETTCYGKLRRWLLPTKRRVPDTGVAAARAA